MEKPSSAKRRTANKKSVTVASTLVRRSSKQEGRKKPTAEQATSTYRKDSMPKRSRGGRLVMSALSPSHADPSSEPIRNASPKHTHHDHMTFLEHLYELRKFIIRALVVLIIGVGVGFFLYEPTVGLLSKPFVTLPVLIAGQQLYVNSVLEGFMVKMKLSFLIGLILTFPIQIFLFLRFLFPAFEPREKKIVFYTLFSSFILILLSVYYSYGKILPLSVQFLTGSGFLPRNVGILLGFGGNIFFVFQFIVVALVLFQFPIILELLMVMKLLKRETMVKSSRFFVIGIVVVAAVITPPDPISLVTIAVPLIVMFYGTLLIAKIFRFGE